MKFLIKPKLLKNKNFMNCFKAIKELYVIKIPKEISKIIK